MYLGWEAGGQENIIQKKHMYSNVHCSTVYNCQAWTQLKCPSREEWIKKTVHGRKEQAFGLSGRRGWDDLRD